MADVKGLILAIVRPLIGQPEAVSLEIEESANFPECNLTVAKEDTGHTVGKQGHITKAIRTIVYSVRINGPKRVRLSILDSEWTLTRR